MATRTIEGTLDTFSVDTGSEVTYLGATSSGNPGESIRAFKKMLIQEAVLLLVIKLLRI